MAVGASPILYLKFIGAHRAHGELSEQAKQSKANSSSGADRSSFLSRRAIGVKAFAFPETPALLFDSGAPLFEWSEPHEERRSIALEWAPTSTLSSAERHPFRGWRARLIVLIDKERTHTFFDALETAGTPLSCP